MSWCEIVVHSMGAIACLAVIGMTVVAARWAIN